MLNFSPIPNLPTPEIGAGGYFKGLAALFFLKGIIILPAAPILWPIAFVLFVIGAVLDD